jgi:pyruvate dehydrogenase E2 component (dihydrolipoamide acetyltransferase)
MATGIYLPRWGMIMEEGRIVCWLKKEGEQVEQGQPIAEVETEKVVNEVEAPVSGVLRVIVAQADEVAEVGALLAVIAASDEDRAAVEKVLAAADGAVGSTVARPAPSPAPPLTPTPKRARIRISPAARKLALEQSVDWRTLSGSGPGGRIVLEDVRRAVATAQAAPPPTPSPGQTIPLSQTRKTIARRTEASIQAPQAALCREIDISALLDLRRQVGPALAQQIGKPLSLTALFVRAVAMTLGKVPILNARLENESIWMGENAHVGVVVAIEDGIVVPVIQEANHKSLVEIALALDDLVRRARAGRLKMDEISGGSFTLSNAGPAGIDFFQALLHPPQVGALGIGRGRQRAIVVDGEIAVRTMAYFCLSSDHRVVDAAPIGQFLCQLDDLLQRPAVLLLEPR